MAKRDENKKINDEVDWHLKRGFDFGHCWGIIYQGIYKAGKEGNPKNKLKALKDYGNHMKQLWEIMDKYDGESWLNYHYKALEQHADSLGFKLSREGITLANIV